MGFCIGVAPEKSVTGERRTHSGVRGSMKGGDLAEIPVDMVVSWEKMSRNPQLELSHL